MNTALFIAVSIITLSASAHHHGSGYPGGNGNTNTPPASSSGSAPVQKGDDTCMSHGQLLSVMNDQAIQWRSTEKSGWLNRVLVSGTVDEVFPDHSGHRHFSLKIGPSSTDHIEVIYNQSFGNMPEVKVGDSAEACGDYIVSTEENGGYPASPDGMLVHWVHRAPRPTHDDGFVILNGVKYGLGNGSGD